MAATPCAGCGRSNDAAMRFCIDCGRALDQCCPACAAPTAADQRFCGMCGAALSTPAPSVVAPPEPRSAEGERKQVTVLFADVANSMDLSERLDPDELTEIMDGLAGACREAVEAYGGRIDKFTGDGVMALFGAPVAQEDHARRACHAALLLVQRAAGYADALRDRGVDLQVRVGLNSGEVIVGAIGGGSWTAVGHTVGLAQRMEALATVGVPHLTEHTAGLVAENFLLRGLGKLTVKGSTLPLGVFALEGASGGSSAAGRRRAGSARLVGRDEEFATLTAALDGAIEGRAQVVGIVGEAGAGKSRLCEELARRAGELGVTVRRTAGVSHAQGVPLLPILGFLRDYFGVAESDAPADVRVKIADRQLALDPDLESELGLIFDFLDVPDPDRPAPRLGPAARQRRVLDVFRRTTARRSERATVLFIFEDLHWFDPDSVAFLEAWLPAFPGSRTLVVLNFRPEFHAPWRHSYYRQLPLAPLDGTAVHELLDELLGPDPSLVVLTGTLRARTGGNPFFVEEIVRSLAADGTLAGEPGAYRLTREAGEVRVPVTVQAVLAGRIDRLPAGAKTVLQTAAVIGRTFTDAVLRTVTGAGFDGLGEELRRLCTEELLQENGPDGEYRFWHPLTQEVAYGTLLTSARRRLHTAVAGALIGLGPERLDEVAALVATHFESAGDDLEAARWQLRAVGRALVNNFTEAQRLLCSAIDHLQAAEETPETLSMGVHARVYRLRLGARTGLATEETERLFAEARPMAQQLGGPGLLAWLGIADANLHLFGGNPRVALAGYRESAHQARLAGDAGVQAFASAAIPIAASYAGPLAEGLAAADVGLALCRDDPLLGADQIGYSVHDAIHAMRTAVLAAAGPLDEARRSAELTRALFGRRPMSEWHTWSLAYLCLILDLIAEHAGVPEATAAAREAQRLAMDSGNAPAGVKASLAAGVAASLAGNPDDAVEHLSSALELTRTHHFARLDEAVVLSHLARAHLACHDAPAARTAADSAVAIAHRQGAAVVECWAHLVRAQVYRSSADGEADLAEARAAVAAGEALAADVGAAVYAAFLAEERARLDNDHAALKACADGYDAIGATGHARRIREEVPS